MTGALGTGAVSESMPSENHVERRPIAASRDFAEIETVAGTVTKLSFATRPAAFGTVVASVIGESIFSAFAIACAVSGTGPQSWYGEIVSYGSGTETRYGSGVPIQSRLDSVRPPDVE